MVDTSTGEATARVVGSSAPPYVSQVDTTYVLV